MRKIMICGFLMALHMVVAQKVVKKSVIYPGTSFIQIDANNCFEVIMETSDSDQMVIEATFDGEYKKEILLHIKEEGSTLLVGTDFQLNFVGPNDKLSAHKVISIALRISVPKQKNVQVFGTSCNLTITGAYEKLGITLNDGRCRLNEVSETVEISTQSGDISVYSSKAKIKANSKYGTVQENQIPNGDNSYTLNTITGNIYLKKIE